MQNAVKYLQLHAHSRAPARRVEESFCYFITWPASLGWLFNRLNFVLVLAMLV